MIRFIQWPWALTLALLLPLAAAVVLSAERRSRARRIAQLGSATMLARLAPLTSRRGMWRRVRLLTACALLGCAFAGPRWGAEQNVVRQNGIDVVLALDASLSMMAPDDRPSRLEKLKQVVRQLRALSPDDRFALIAFAGRSYILSPLTTDDGALGLYLDNLDPSVVGQAGSSLASAIRQGTNLLNLTQGGADRAVVVMSDGEGFESEDDVKTEAKRAAAAGIQLVTVGFGTTQGSTIPVVTDGRQALKRDEAGAVVVTRYSPTLLRDAADAADGVFIPAEAAGKAAQIRHVLDGLKTQSRSVSTGRNLSPQFQWFVAPAMLLLLLDTLLTLRVRRRVAAAAAATLLAACGPRPDTPNMVLYNRGTMTLTHDSLTAAVPPLDSAAHSVNRLVRFRAAFNGGWAYLIPGLRLKGDSALPKLQEALTRYRFALVTMPNDSDAKWNYELALRNPPKSGGGGGGGGGGAGGSGPAKPSPAPAGSIGAQQAEALLNSAEREERDVQGRKQRKNVPQPPPQGKDW